MPVQNPSESFSGPKVVQKCQNVIQKWSKSAKSGPEVVQKWSKSGPEVVPALRVSWVEATSFLIIRIGISMRARRGPSRGDLVGEIF